MPVYKKPKGIRVKPGTLVEKHFHDYDETWIVMDGKMRAFMVDRNGEHSEFELEQGDVWMIEAGVEHGGEPVGDGVLAFAFPGTIPEGSHQPGHYYMEKEHYMPTLQVKRIPIDRYQKGGNDA